MPRYFLACLTNFIRKFHMRSGSERKLFRFNLFDSLSFRRAFYLENRIKLIPGVYRIFFKVFKLLLEEPLALEIILKFRNKKDVDCINSKIESFTEI